MPSICRLRRCLLLLPSLWLLQACTPAEPKIVDPFATFPDAIFIFLLRDDFEFVDQIVETELRRRIYATEDFRQRFVVENRDVEVAPSKEAFLDRWLEGRDPSCESERRLALPIAEPEPAAAGLAPLAWIAEGCGRLVGANNGRVRLRFLAGFADSRFSVSIDWFQPAYDVEDLGSWLGASPEEPNARVAGWIAWGRRISPCELGYPDEVVLRIRTQDCVAAFEAREGPSLEQGFRLDWN